MFSRVLEAATSVAIIGRPADSRASTVEDFCDTAARHRIVHYIHR